MNHDFVSNIIAAPFTPMNEMGAIKPSSIPDYAKKLKKDGLAGVFICGTTGEGMSLTVAERKNRSLRYEYHGPFIFKTQLR
jgi:N-acetylneuraminate lyase